MLKITKLTKEELIDEISEFRQKVIKLQSEITRLRQPDDSWPIMPNDAPWQPYEWRPWKYPYLPISASGTRVLPNA